MSANLPKRFSLSLTTKRWRRLLVELQAMEREHAMRAAGSVEKLLERTRAGQQLLVFVRCVVEETRAVLEGEINEPEGDPLRKDLPLQRPMAKYLLTACDRLRRTSLHEAWQTLRQTTAGPVADLQSVLEEAKQWDLTMRELSLQHGVVHPLAELVEPLPLGEAELAQLGIPCSQLLNGEDLLAS